jgi:hypothetical protein
MSIRDRGPEGISPDYRLPETTDNKKKSQLDGPKQLPPAPDLTKKTLEPQEFQRKLPLPTSGQDVLKSGASKAVIAAAVSSVVSDKSDLGKNMLQVMKDTADEAKALSKAVKNIPRFSGTKERAEDLKYLNREYCSFLKKIQDLSHGKSISESGSPVSTIQHTVHYHRDKGGPRREELTSRDAARLCKSAVRIVAIIDADPQLKKALQNNKEYADLKKFATENLNILIAGLNGTGHSLKSSYGPGAITAHILGSAGIAAVGSIFVPGVVVGAVTMAVAGAVFPVIGAAVGGTVALGAALGAGVGVGLAVEKRKRVRTLCKQLAAVTGQDKKAIKHLKIDQAAFEKARTDFIQSIGDLKKNLENMYALDSSKEKQG